jgi:hypothetical protein
MTMSITMIQTRMGESGSLLTAGNTYSVGDAFGLAMIGAGYALDTNNVRRQPVNDAGTISSYTAAQLAALAAAGGLTPYAAYVASDTGVRYTAGAATALYTEGFGWAPVIAQAQHLRRTAAKLANARNSPVVVNCFGHSIVDGGYANDVVTSVDSAVETVWKLRAFPAVLRDLFATHFGSVAGDAFSPAGLGSRLEGTKVGAGATAVGPYSSQAFGGSYWNLAAGGAPLSNYISFAGTGSVLRVRGLINSSGAAINYSVDGIGTTTALAVKASTVQSPRTNGFYWFEVDIPLGAVTAHTVYIQQHATLVTIICDVRFISDITKGVYVGRYGYSGACLPEMFACALDTTDVAGPAWLSSVSTSGWYDQQAKSCVGRSNSISLLIGNATSITNASPAVVSYTAHGLNAGDAVTLGTGGALPTGLSTGVTYYVMSTGLTANAFQLAPIPESAGGVAINTSSAGSGTHTITRTTRGFSTDLAIIMCDANDSAGYTTYAYSLADVQRHAQNVANKLVALGVDVLFVTGPGRDAPTHPWTYAQNVAAYKAVADATDRVGHLDLGAAWADYNDGNANGLFVDYVHLSSTGHAFVGKSLYRALMAL